MNAPHDPITTADDPRVTAYALGEASAEQRAAVEAWLAEHPEQRAEVEALAELGGALSAEYEQAPADALDDARRAELERALGGDGAAATSTGAGGNAPSGPGGDADSSARRNGSDTPPVTPVATRPLALRPFLAAAIVLVAALLVVDQAVLDGGLFGGGAIGRADQAPTASAPADAGKAIGELRDQKSLYARSESDELEPLRELGYAGPSRTYQLEQLGYLSGGQGGGGGGERIDEMREEAKIALGSSLDASVLPEALYDDASGNQVLTIEGGTGGTQGQADEVVGLGGVGGLYKGAADSGNAGGAQGGNVAPPTNPGNVSGSPGLLTGRGRKRVAPGAAVTEPVPSVSPRSSTGPRSARGQSGRRGATVAGAQPTEVADLGPEELELLRSLGYIDADAEDDARGRTDYNLVPARKPSAESYAKVPENPFVRLTGDPQSALSTFGLDVDTASYSNVRRYLNRNQAPPPAAVRLEELVNAFTYDDPAPTEDALGVTLEVAQSPWAPSHRLVRVGIKGREIRSNQRPPTSLTFLLDVSGSMKDADKLPLLTQSLELMLDELRPDDRVAIVTYASGTELVLPSTPVSDRATIVSALRGLHADGSTHASAGIELAYQVATDAFLDEGNNRVLLATDGDFNVGVTSQGGLQDLITEKAAGGIYLTVLGFGTGNLKDDTAELLADKGNGHYAYIDSLDEAHRVLVRELEGTLHVIAKDAKVQVEFNPAKVQSYRLLGYENRALAAEDFRNDAKDAGEVGAGHSLTVLYEIVPVGVQGEGGTAELRYQTPVDPTTLSDSPDLLTVNLRWLPPSGDGEATERAYPLVDEGGTFADASDDLRFASAVAALGMALRRSDHRGDLDLLDVATIAERAKGSDADGRRAELVKLIRTAKGVLGE